MSESRRPAVPPRQISPFIGVVYAVCALLLAYASVQGHKFWLLVVALAFAGLAWVYLARAIRRP